MNSQNVIDCAFTPPIVPRPHTHMICEKVDEITSIPSFSLGFGTTSTSNGKGQMKAKILQC